MAHEAMGAWMAFLVLALTGERRELMRRQALSAPARGLYKAAVLLLPAAVLLALLDALVEMPQVGWLESSTLVWWAGCLLLGGWMLRHDSARQDWSAPGWAGLQAQALCVGYGWLLAGALLGLAGRWWPMAAMGPAWHAVLLGFAFSLVFGLAPMLLQARAGIAPRYTPWLKLPLWLLAASLLLRIGASGFGHPALQAAAGIGQALAIGGWALWMARAAWPAGR